MKSYSWCGLTIQSALEFPELLPSLGAGAAAWRITGAAGWAPERPDRHWFHTWELAGGRPWAAFARDPLGYVVRFVEIGDYEIDLQARTIRYCDPGLAPPHTMRHMLLDQVLPLLAGDEARLAIHASVIEAPEGAIAILATTGHGKSTMAARFAQRGYRVLTDDCCVLEITNGVVSVVPAYPGLRLRPDSIVEALASTVDGAEPVAHYSTKLRATVSKGVKFRREPVKLARFYVIRSIEELKRERQIRITTLRGKQAMLDLVEFTFHLDVGDKARMRQSFTLAAEIAARYPTRQLSFPWGWMHIDRVIDAILEDADA